ncbi:hypothetical protein HNO53_20670 [Billgrantia antri]|uniref:DUF1640 domain-containing protein n=1 Tax=Halomonas sulfidivorans TaxID=2733488 RepID=A0ABX7WPU8_9GAMM|nr:hypothetical protein [Halomonas sulfidivorans]QTP60913.1 hypothetical protein HNO53_20670 [Halomonas sulfidivorans]
MYSSYAGPVIMAEVNERLARVETKVDTQADVMARLERHLETMSASHAEMAKTVSQIPALFNQMLDIQRTTADQGDRLTVLERDMEHARTARDHLRNVIEPKVNRSHFVSSATAWLAALVLTAFITASTKGWLE